MVSRIAISRGRNLPQIVANSIRDAISGGTLPDSGKLPSEPALAAMFGVSRATVREAITLLESDGIVDRRHGSGTFLLPSAGLTNNINVNFGVTDVIESSGQRPGSINVRVHRGPGPARPVRSLGLESGAEVITFLRTRTADDRPVADVTDIVPVARLTDAGIQPDELTDLVARTESVGRALDKLGLVIHHGIAEISPAAATEAQARRLGLRKGALLLRITQVDYSPGGEAIVYSDEFHVGDAFSVTVYRKGSSAR